jgi:hypothetical protein
MKNSLTQVGGQLRQKSPQFHFLADFPENFHRFPDKKPQEHLSRRQKALKSGSIKDRFH